MKKTDWTDRMLAALVELYPVETTAYTAAVLNLSESTVKLKARELGLVKMAKSRWMERADYIRNHFQECSFSEIGKALDITRMSVGRIAAAIGLKRSSEEKHLISSRYPYSDGKEGKTAYRLRTGTHNRYPCHFKQGKGKGTLKHEVKRIHHQ